MLFNIPSKPSEVFAHTNRYIFRKEFQMKLKKKFLFIIAGILWTFAGSMIISTGLKAWIKVHNWWVNLIALAVYLLFYLFVFSKLVKKHEKRIVDEGVEKMPWWQFFDRKSYIVMIVMMTVGVIIRKSGLLPIEFFGSFYMGLGFALFSCGLRFIYLLIKHKAL